MNITYYIPHRGKMSLLDELIVADDDRAIAAVTIQRDSLFATDKGISASVGIEYMAQTIAAYSGAIDRRAGQSPKIGLLLGSRRYDSQIAYFNVGDTLQITVSPIYVEENALGVFDCHIDCNGRKVATATLNVLQPERIEDYF